MRYINLHLHLHLHYITLHYITLHYKCIPVPPTGNNTAPVPKEYGPFTFF